MNFNENNFISKRCEEIKNMFENIIENIYLFDEQKNSVDSKTMKDLLDKNFKVSVNILMNYVEVFNSFKDYLKSSYETDLLIGDGIGELSKCTVEITKRAVELGASIKSNDVEDIIKLGLDSLILNKQKLETIYLLSDVCREICVDTLYLSVLSFSLAINTNDYNKHERMKESILNFIKTTLSPFLGDFPILYDFIESFTQIINSTDKYYLMKEFVGNTDKNLVKIEVQLDCLKLVFYNQQMLIEMIAQIKEDTEKALKSAQKNHLEDSTTGA